MTPLEISSQKLPPIEKNLKTGINPVLLSLNLNPLECRGNYSATSNNTKLVHWPLMGGLLHLVQQGGDWAGPQPAQALFAVPNVTVHLSTASVPITVLMYNGPLIALRF